MITRFKFMTVRGGALKKIGKDEWKQNCLRKKEEEKDGEKKKKK